MIPNSHKRIETKPMDITRNLVFLSERDLDRPVYRIFSLDRLHEIFQERQLTLVKPKLWEDPFENFILNSAGILPDGREFQIGFREHFYGQCWSLTKESDAMWRIYSPNRCGVKVKTTIRKLFLALLQHSAGDSLMGIGSRNTSAFVGRVRYARAKKLEAMLQDKKRMSGKIFDKSGRGQASSFFFKRWAFRHENEIRLIFNLHHNSTSDVFKFTVDPLELFDEIVFDPRMDERDYMEHKATVRLLGYSNSIIQSGLYKIRNFTVSLSVPE